MIAKVDDLEEVKHKKTRNNIYTKDACINAILSMILDGLNAFNWWSVILLLTQLAGKSLGTSITLLYSSA